MSILDRMLDRSIFFSFDRSGYLRHQRTFDPSDLDCTMRDKVCLVTGANSGLGLAVSSGLAAREATVHMLCRNEERGSAARDAMVKETGNGDVHLHVVDVSSLKSVRDFADRFDESAGRRAHPQCRCVAASSESSPKTDWSSPSPLIL